MDEQKIREIKNKLDSLNNQNRFETAIALIETIPEEEKDLEIKVCHAHMLNNIAMVSLGEYDERSEHYQQNAADDENSPKVPYIREAIERLEALKEEGQEDWYWNKRMAEAYYSMGHVLISQSLHYYSLALPYFKKYYELERNKEKNAALKRVDECIENLADRYFAQKKYLEGFSLVNTLSGKWNGYEPNFAVTGIEDGRKKDIDEVLAEKLDELAEKGNILLDEERDEEALSVWQEAIDLIPEPKSEKAEVVWFEASLGNIYFEKGCFNEANVLFSRAVHNLTGEGLENPFILMRYGECLYELGKKKAAKSYLLKAYMLDGEDVFRSEEQNLKYLDFLLKELTNA